jgi:PAS domain S-box
MSVRRLLTIACIAAGLLPILIFGVAFRPVLEEHIDYDTKALADSMLRALSAQAGSSLLDGASRDLSALLIFVESLRSGASGRAWEGQALGAFRLPHSEYAMLALLDAEGRILASSSSAPAVGVYALHSPLVPGSVSFSDPFVSPVTGAVAVEAAYSNGRRTVVALLDLGEISSKLITLSGSTKDRLGVVDGKGRYLACSEPSRALGLEPVDPRCLVAGPARIESEGSAYYASSRPLAGTSWRVLYMRDAAEADAPLSAFLGSLGILLIAAMACTLGVSLFTWREISTPLSALVSRIDLIADGRYSERVEGSFASEFMEIARAFNAMAESIERRDRDLQDEEERFRLLFYRNGVPTLVVDPESWSIRDANDAAAEYYGYGREGLIGKTAGDIDPAATADLRADIDAAAAGRRTHFLARHRLASGELRDVELYVCPIPALGRSDLYCAVFDVTQRRLAEEKTAKALQERTLLLREVYHRVKNNLQITSSLLNLQAEGLEDETALRALRVAQDRVYAMSLAHELVYQMEDLASIELDDYADRLAANLRGAYGVEKGSILLDLAPMRLQLDRAIPFGLVLNELVVNSLKYAAPSTLSPILVRLELAAEGSDILFSVEDEGPGIPLEFREAGGKKGSIGLSLVEALAKQLGGGVSWGVRDDGSGSRAVLRFPSRSSDGDPGARPGLSEEA